MTENEKFEDASIHDLGDLDFSNEAPKTNEQELIEKPYDPRQFEDEARKNIAYSLIALLFLVVIWIFLLLCRKVVSISDLKEFSVILSPLLTLVSAATGFYYGTKNQK